MKLNTEGSRLMRISLLRFLKTVSLNMVFLIPQNQCYPGTPCVRFGPIGQFISFSLFITIFSSSMYFQKNNIFFFYKFLH